jgi:serine/threonine protein kinase
VGDHEAGRTLADYLAANGRMPLGEGLATLDELLRLVGERWHRAGTAHGSLSPACVLLRENGRVEVLPVDAAGARPDEAVYRSPQQRDGAPADARADVYALGVIAYQTLTGVLPYAPGAAQPTDPREAVPKLSDRVRTSLLIAVQPNLTERFADALTFRAALRGDSDLALANPTLAWAVPEGIPEGDTGAAEAFACEEPAGGGEDDL